MCMAVKFADYLQIYQIVLKTACILLGMAETVSYLSLFSSH